jgi:hypothetical protein
MTTKKHKAKCHLEGKGEVGRGGSVSDEQRGSDQEKERGTDGEGEDVGEKGKEEKTQQSRLDKRKRGAVRQ